MPSIATKSLSITSAKEFINAVSTPAMNVNLYVAISHVDPWSNDSSPDTPIDNNDTKIKFWRSMVGGKRINGYDMALAIPRINYTANTVYTPYRNYGNTIFGQNFYILTDAYNVYKCIDNNNNANSTVQPSFTNYQSVVTTSDGYTWKFMYGLSSSDRQRFLTSSWMPVKDLTLDDGSIQYRVQQNSIGGGIEFVQITNRGNNYNSNAFIVLTGDGINANLVPVVNSNSQNISSITSVNPGGNYHFANTVIFPTANTSGANATAIPIIGPFGGHGSNPVEELGGSNVIININLDADENGTLPVDNDYRQIGIIKNPMIFGANNQVYSNLNFTQSLSVSVGVGGGAYALDELVFQGTSVANSTFSGIVVDWNSANNILDLAQLTGTPSSSILVGSQSGTTRFVINTVNPNLIPYSGDVLYLDNVSPITRNPNQLEEIQIVLSF
jgi:hypothetical protein